MEEQNKQIKHKLLAVEEEEVDQNGGDVQDVTIKKQSFRSRKQRANILSKILFWWAQPLVKLGNKTHLEQEHLEQLSDNEKSSYNYDKFKIFFSGYVKKSKQPLIRTLLSRIILSFIIAFFDSCVLMATPYLIKLVIEYSSQENQNYKEGIVLVAAIILSRILLCLLDSHSYYQFSSLGYDLTNTVSVALFDKSLRYSLLSTDQFKVGGLVNMLQVDAQRLLTLCNYVSNMVFLPLQLGFGLYLMEDSIGISFLFGVALMVIMGAVNFGIGRFQLRFQKRQMVEKDERMKITTEIFNAIKFIKANAWEEYFYDKLDSKRNDEIQQIKNKFYCGTMSIFSLWITPMLIINATFAGYVLLGNIMTPQKAFTVISIFSILQEPIRSIPMVINYFIETFVSVKRIENYLQQDDINLKFLTHDQTNTSNKPFAIKISNGNFYWRSQKKEQQNNQEEQAEENSPNLKKEQQQQPSLTQNNDQQQSFAPVESEEYDENRNEKSSQIIKDQNEIQQSERANIVLNQESTLSSNYNSTILFNDKLQPNQIQTKEVQPSLEKTNQQQQQQQQKLEQKENEQSSKYILKGINITIPKGKLVAFIGDVGCGKSSILQCIIGEMKYDEDDEEGMPKVEINGDISIVNQKPWILNATVKENILFGQPLDEKRYQDCIKYACLLTDFKVLGDGDQTQIGEKGVNLSGGQKARISLARSLYSNSSILLLDDILSAVDVHVGKSILLDCLLKYKKNSTRVLATHALNFLKYMDYVFFMKDGQIFMEGDYSQVQKCPEFQEIYEKYMKDQFTSKKGVDLDTTESKHDNQDPSPLSNNNNNNNNNIGKEDEQQKNKVEQGQQEKNLDDNQKFKEIKLKSELFSKTANQQTTSEDDEDEEDVVIDITNEKEVIAQSKHNERLQSKDKTENLEIVIEDDNKDYLMLKEDRKKGNIQWVVVSQFFKLNGGFWYVFGVLFSMTLWQGLKMASSIWISLWTEDNDPSKNNFYLIIYSIFSISYGIFAMIRAAICLGGSVLQARFMHKNIISALIFAPLNEFFERVPIGRIFNILSKDLQVLDQEVGYTVGSLMVNFFSLIGDTSLCVYSSSLYVLIPISLFLLISKLLQMYYMNAQREVVRLETLSRSPIISFFAETLNGLSSIRAFAQQDRFQQLHCKNIDENKKCQFSFIGMESWFKQNLTFFSLIVNIAAISFCLFWNKNSPSMTGLLLTYAFSIDQTVQGFIRTWNYVEKNFVSVERCHSFTQIQAEKGYTSYLEKREEYRKQIAHPLPQDEDPLFNWPQKGQINFEALELKYRVNLECVIKGISASIKPSEKVGIVGRTGAGKSTITLSLLRIIEAFKGKIVIDGVDISQIRLDQLRRKITIILQDPQLFDGSLRDNIDPLKQFSDEEIIETLEKCRLTKLTQSEKGLESYINEGGENLSVGEKQLICIARALLKKSKIVLIDEATANIDIQTDHMIQQTIQSVFKDCTVLTIAHRLNTILNSDRIIVLSQGHIQEFDSPANLLKNPQSHFYSIYQESAKENNI